MRRSIKWTAGVAGSAILAATGISPVAAQSAANPAAAVPPPPPIDTAAPTRAAGTEAQPATAAEPTPAAAPASADSATGLQDIVVTAQRRSENLQRAAIAVTAVSGAALARAGVTDSSQLTRLVPALQISSAFGPTNNFYLRGVGNFVANSLAEPAIAFNVDGVNFARPTSAQGVFYDLERIEVLKGPQGTLYGRNATGGAINVITAKPKLGELGGYANFEYGNYDAKKVNAAINVPMGENGALRIAGQFVDRDGTYSDGTADDKRKAIRATFASQLTETFKLTLSGDYEHQGGSGTGSTVYGLDKNDRIGLFDPRAEAIVTSSFAPSAKNTLNALTPDYYNHNNYWGVYAQADIATAIGTLTILPAYRRSELDFRTYASSFAVTTRENDDQTSVEARLASDNKGPLSYVLGGFYMHEKTVTNAGFDQQYFAGYALQIPKTDSYAGFARLTYKLSSALRVSGGVRYTLDDKSAYQNSVNGAVVCLSAACPGTPALPNTIQAPAFLLTPAGTAIPFQPYGPGGAFVAGSRNIVDPAKKFRKVTYRAGVEYDVAPTSLLYGSFETGFKSGGFYQSIDSSTFKPETITAFTLGSKNRFLDNKLQVNVEAFRWNYKDQQVALFRTNSQGSPEFITANIGKTRLQGVEVETQARVLAGTTLNATVQYLDARDKSFVYQNSAIVGPPTTGCAVSGPSGTPPGVFTVDCSGRRPSQAPVWTVSGGIEQRISLGDAGDLVFNAQTRYQSSIYTGIELLAAQRQKGYMMTDLELSYALPGGRFTLSGFVNNLENKNVVGFSQPQAQAPSLLIENLRDPRTYGVRAGVKF